MTIEQLQHGTDIQRRTSQTQNLLNYVKKCRIAESKNDVVTTVLLSNDYESLVRLNLKELPALKQAYDTFMLLVENALQKSVSELDQEFREL